MSASEQLVRELTRELEKDLQKIKDRQHELELLKAEGKKIEGKEHEIESEIQRLQNDQRTIQAKITTMKEELEKALEKK